ncbi:hypothetical protein OH77DRAFT_295318 [Trametes cingulata]|nr:hypothetical protein OH77DRAFT_295318 [Trametes cingulata]
MTAFVPSCRCITIPLGLFFVCRPRSIAADFLSIIDYRVPVGYTPSCIEYGIRFDILQGPYTARLSTIVMMQNAVKIGQTSCCINHSTCRRRL